MLTSEVVFLATRVLDCERLRAKFRHWASRMPQRSQPSRLATEQHQRPMYCQQQLQIGFGSSTLSRAHAHAQNENYSGALSLPARFRCARSCVLSLLCRCTVSGG